MTLNPARLARFTAWAKTLPLPPLPRTAIPAPGEFHLGYVRRLAEANYLEFLQLCDVLHNPGAHTSGRRTWKELQQERLALVADQPLARIARLCWPEGDEYVRDPAGFRRGLRPACRRCAARRGIREPVFCKLPRQLTVCRRHRLWIGPDVRTVTEQVDLAAFPEYLTAQRRHQRLHQQHRHATAAAWRDAEIELHRKVYRCATTSTLQDRLARFCPDRRRGDHLDQPGVAAALYPDLVRLTSRLLATTLSDSSEGCLRSRWAS